MFVVPSWTRSTTRPRPTATSSKSATKPRCVPCTCSETRRSSRTRRSPESSSPGTSSPRASADTTATVESVVLANRALGAVGQADLIWGHASARDPERARCLDEGRGLGFRGDHPAAGRARLAKRARCSRARAGATSSSRSTLRSTDGDPTSAWSRTHAAAAVVFASPRRPGPRWLRTTGCGSPIPTSRGFARPETSSVIATLGCALASVVGDGPGCLIPQHGLVTVGATVAEAVMRAVCLDRACHVQLLAMSAGGPHTWSDPDEVERKRAEVWTPEQVAAGFEYLCRLSRARP